MAVAQATALSGLSPPAMVAHVAALCCVAFTAAALWVGAGAKGIIPLLYLTMYAEYQTTGTYSVFLTLFVFYLFKDDITGLFVQMSR